MQQESADFGRTGNYRDENEEEGQLSILRCSYTTAAAPETGFLHGKLESGAPVDTDGGLGGLGGFEPLCKSKKKNSISLNQSSKAHPCTWFLLGVTITLGDSLENGGHEWKKLSMCGFTS